MSRIIDPRLPNKTTQDTCQSVRVASLSLFEGIGAVPLAAIESEFEWFSLPAGSTLFREGDAGNELYILISGRLEASVRGAAGDDVVVAQISATEPVGEMALISHEPRSATVVAIRDSELVRLSRPAFERLIEAHPKAMLRLTQVLVRRLRQTTRGIGLLRPRRTLVFVPLLPDLPLAALTADLVQVLSHSGRRVFLADAGVADRSSDWFNTIEAKYDLVVYRAGEDADAWTRFCLRQADCVLFVAKPGAPGQIPPHIVALLPDLRRGRCELVVLHDAFASTAVGTAAWLQRLPVDSHCHVRLHNSDDLSRLARTVTREAVGLVLSGGGARGFGHLGVIRALREHGTPLDLVGGTSIGAIIAAGLALGWSNDELVARMRRAFVDTDPLNDYTLPLISLVRGAKVTCLLRENFGEIRIEDLWQPYFCTSSNLTTGNVVVHRSGPLWRALRASIAIPGVLPPVVEGGEVLVDGGVLDNLPLSVMDTLRRGPVIGVDVASGRALGSAPQDLETGSPLALLRSRGRRPPNIIRLLMRAGTVSSDLQSRERRKVADFLLELPLAATDMLNWQSFDRVIDVGYRYTRGILEGHGAPLFQSELPDRSGQQVSTSP